MLNVYQEKPWSVFIKINLKRCFWQLVKKKWWQWDIYVGKTQQIVKYGGGGGCSNKRVSKVLELGFFSAAKFRNPAELCHFVALMKPHGCLRGTALEEGQRSVLPIVCQDNTSMSTFIIFKVLKNHLMSMLSPTKINLTHTYLNSMVNRRLNGFEGQKRFFWGSLDDLIYFCRI